MGSTQRIALIELERAQKRVGQLPEQRFRWALNFAQEDLDELSAGDMYNRRLELLAFNSALIWWDRMPAPMRDKLLPKFGNHRDVSGDLHLWLVPTEAELRSVHKWLLRFLASFRTDTETVIGGLKARLVIGEKPLPYGCDDLPEVPFYGAAGTSQTNIRVPFSRTQDSAIARFSELAQAYLRMLRRCPEPDCARWFLATRRNNDYCTKTCLNRALSKRFRSKKGGKRGTHKTR